MYIPYNAIAGVSGTVVSLKPDVATVAAKGWSRPPAWIAELDKRSLDPAGLTKVGSPRLMG
jgi:hypothetical protein